MRASVDVNKVHQRFGERAQFFQVYLREAHPTDGWKMKNSKIKDPLTQLERNLVASQCGKQLKYKFPTIIDTMKDATAVRWAAWPERIFVIDVDGKIAYAGHQGPWGFWPTNRFKRSGRMKLKGDSLEAFLEKTLHETSKDKNVEP